MGETQALKRLLLHQAVRENVDTIKGRYRFKRPSPASRIQTFSRVFFFFAVPIGLFFSSYLIASVADEWLASRRLAQTASGSPPTPLAEAPAPRPMVSQEQIAALATAPRVNPAAFSLAVRRVVIDPGHGGENFGTEAASGLREKELALDISERLEGLLAEDDFEVELTRRDDSFVSLEERASFANARRGDVFVSIHLNWIETRQVRGIETYYLGPTDDPYLTRLAAEENRDSGYSLADYRSMLDRVYADARQSESRRLATAVQRSLYNSLRQINPKLQNRGVKKAPFIVLTGTEMPAILAEVSCLSNEKEARLLMTPEYRQYIAEALFDGIRSYARDIGGLNQTGS